MRHKKNKESLEPTTPIVYGTKEYDNHFYYIYTQYVEKISDIECKSYVLKYTKEINQYSDSYKSILPKKFNPCGIYIKMQNDGIVLPNTEKQIILEFVEQLNSYNKNRIEKKQNSLKQKTTKDVKKINEIHSIVEYQIDQQLERIQQNKKTNLEIAQILKTYKLDAAQFSALTVQISSSINKSIVDLQLAKQKKDEQLSEGYSYLTPKQLSEYINFLKNLQINIMSCYTKQERKKRKLKVKTPEQLVKKLQVIDSFDELKLVSCPKSEIIGSKIIFTYNTKTRSIIKYTSSSEFSINGSTLINIDLTKSYKKTVRRPDKVFLSINRTNMEFMERLWNSIKSKETTTNARINKNCILISCLHIK